MKKILIFTILLFFPLIASAESLPSYPMLFWGNVTVNGSVAPAGTVVRTYYGNTLAGQVTLKESGVYGYSEATKQKLLVSEGAGKITFKFQSTALNNGVETGGVAAVEHPNFVSGLSVNKNLSFTLASQSSGGGGGGGGGSGTVNLPNNYSQLLTTSNSGSVVSADLNKDGLVDLLDFNLLMVNWGKTGSNLTGDMNHDSVVDLLDFNLLIINWTI